MPNVLAIGAAVVSLLALPLTSPAADAATATPGGKVTIEVVAINGSGCPAGTARVIPSTDNTAFKVIYSDFVAQDGDGAQPTDIRKNCQITVQINVPQGFTYAIAEAEYRGYARLAAGATGQEIAGYYFMGESATTRVGHSFAGPMSERWQTTDATDVAALVYAPCGVVRDLNINTELRVDAGTLNPAKRSFMSMSATDASIQTIYHFAWKQCG